MSKVPRRQNDNSAGNNPDNSRVMSSKRMRHGRRRKYPKPGEAGCRYILLDDDNNHNPNPAAAGRTNQTPPARGNNNIGSSHPLVPPGFEAINGKRKRQREQQEINNNDSSNINTIKVGQTLTIVIDGEFDGGYYISVTNPSSSSSPALRGIIFKPGSPYNNNTTNNGATIGGVPLVPITVDVPMIPLPLSTSPQQQVHISQNPLQVPNTGNIENIEQKRVIVNESLKRINESDIVKATRGPANSSCKLGPLLPPGSFVPVVLKPANLPPPSRVLNQAASLGKGKSVNVEYQDPFMPINRPSPALGISPPFLGGRESTSFGGRLTLEDGRINNQAATSSSLISQSVLLPQQNSENVNVRSHPSSSAATVVDGISGATTDQACATLMKQYVESPFDFEKLVSEVVKRIRARPDFPDLVNEINNSGVRGSSKSEHKGIDLEEMDHQAMPQQAVLCVPHGPLLHAPSSSDGP